MKLTARDRIPIGQAKTGSSVRFDGEYTMKRSDTFQMTWRQLCFATGLQDSTFYTRIKHYGMAPIEALRTRRDSYNHVVMSMKDICYKVGTHPRAYESRRRRGWSIRESLLGRGQ